MHKLPWMKFCGYCGSQFAEQGLARLCASCGNFTYASNKTAVVLSVPVWDNKSEKILGFILSQRNIQPKKGEFCFVSGCQDFKEPIEITAAREFQEEILNNSLPNGGREYFIDPATIKLHGMELGAGGTINLITTTCNGISFNQWLDIINNFKPNEEVSQIKLVSEPTELAFEIQTKFLAEEIERYKLLGKL